MEQNQEPKNWKPVDPGMWKPTKESEAIIGVLVNVVEKSNNLSTRYYLDTCEGIKLVWGCTVLDDRMKLVKLGQFVKITYKGKQKNAKKQDINIYSVEIADD